MHPLPLRLLLALLAPAALVSPSAATLASAATTYYVSPTGNDANDGRSTSTPWKTFKKAQNVLVAGDTLLARGGQYVTDFFQPANNGTQSAPITIKAYPGETPVLTGDPTWDVYFNILRRRT